MTSALILAGALLTGCSDPAPGDGPVPDRLAVIAGLRTVDVCALYNDADTVEARPLTVLGFSSPLNCDATIEDPAGEADATIALNIGPAQPVGEEPSWLRHEVIDGVDVSIASSAEKPDAPPRDQVSSWSCELSATYPDKARLTVSVSAAPEVDGCAIADPLMRTAIGAFEQRPQRGSGGSALSGADPCRPAERLRAAHTVDIAAEDVTVNSCMFTVDGGPPVDVSFSYQDPAMIEVNPDQFTVEGHRVVGDEDLGVFDVVVGENTHSSRGPVVPLVSIVEPAANMDLIRMVAQAIAEEF
jgi:hypothetical protein